MKPINKDALIRNVVITLITSWFTWLCIWPSSCNKSLPTSGEQQTSILLKSQHVQLVSEYRHEIAVFKSRNDSLQKELSATKQQLLVYQNNVRRNKILVQDRVNKQSADTITKLADCDSLKQEVGNYIITVEQEDSLQQKAITELEAVVVNKDSALAFCEQHFESMTNLAMQSLDGQQKLEKDLQKANNKLKRRVVLTRILAGTTIVLTAVTAAFIIH